MERSSPPDQISSIPTGRQHPGMRLRILISAGLLGVLAAFVGFAFDWTITAHGEVTYEMPGEPSTITVGVGGEEASPGQGALPAGRQLRDYVASRGLALLVSSTGDGLPRLIAADPEDAVPWLAASAADPGDVLLFEGTYSHRQWESTGSGPFLPADATVRGVISAPGGVDDLQYVQMLADDTVLPPGTYIVNTRDHETLNGLVSLLATFGLRVHDSRDIPLDEFLVRDPLIGVTVALFAFGLLATALHWTLLSVSKLPESRIRRQHGARTFDLTRRELVDRLPWLIVGSAIGVCLAAVTVASVGRAPLSATQWTFLGVCWVAAVLMSMLISTGGSFAALRPSKEARDAA